MSLVDELLRPGAYPAPLPTRVELATTHASWVFLTDTEAWKVKRPVDYGFLDFSTYDKRRRCCDEELRLGARLAPNVYRGVAPIFRGPEGLSLRGPGEVVEHAVRMRRLRDGDSAATRVADGRLTPAHLERLATRLASFYEQSPVTPEYGSEALFAANIDENLRQTRPSEGAILDAEPVEQLHRWQRAELARLAPRLEARATAGRVREGHGDLRLEHVYVEGDEVLVIDPIEFNAAFRCGDVALDVAFLAMELDAVERRDLAAVFLSAFARASNDYGFYPLLDLYLSYRAWVRAKVACFVALDPSTPPAKAGRKRDEARRLMSLASSYAQPRATPAAPVVAIGGIIGTGKSAVADALVPLLGTAVVSSDHTRKHLAGLDPWARGGRGLYSDEVTRATYDEMLRRADDVLDSGRGVILDATFRSPALRAGARALAARWRRPFVFVELDCDDAVLAERLRRRAAGPRVSDADVELLGEARAGFERADELLPRERLRLDATRDPDDLARAVFRAVT